MKILISGGSGFIGQHLARYILDQGHQAVILDINRSRIASPQLQFFEVDLLKLFLQETADVVLFSQEIVPKKLLEFNFQFFYPRLSDAFKEIFSEKSYKNRAL